MLNAFSGFLSLAVTILIERKRIHAAILEIRQDWLKPKYISAVKGQDQDRSQNTTPRKVKKAGTSIFSKLAFFFKSLVAITGSAFSFGIGVGWMETSLWLRYIISNDAAFWLAAAAMLFGMIFGATFLRKKPWAMVIFVPLGFVFWNFIAALSMNTFRSIFNF